MSNYLLQFLERYYQDSAQCPDFKPRDRPMEVLALGVARSGTDCKALKAVCYRNMNLFSFDNCNIETSIGITRVRKSVSGNVISSTSSAYLEPSYHSFDLLVAPEQLSFWREATKAKFEGGTKFTREDWYLLTLF